MSLPSVPASAPGRTLRFGRPGAPRWSTSSAGFTLVELMVALALAAMISVSIMFISSQARQAYDEAVKKVDVYNRFRFALVQLESDIRNWIATGELEPFMDGRGRGARLNLHWDPGEEVTDTKDELGDGVIDGGIHGSYDEYASIIQRQYYSTEPGQSDRKIHDAFQMYFRSLMHIGGSMREVNVEYALLDPSKIEEGNPTIPPPPLVVEPSNVANLALFKIVRYFDVNPRLVNRPTDTPIVRKLIEVCSNITDFRVEYMVTNGKPEPGFRTPEEEYRSYAEAESRPKQDPNLAPGSGGPPGYRKLFGYGSMKLDVNFPRASAIPGIRGDDGLMGTSDPRPVRFGFEGNPGMFFGELIAGDNIFIFTASERADIGQGAAAQSAGNATKLVRFPAGDYTIKQNIKGLLEFDEDIDTTEWVGRTQTGILYKAAYMPSAIRITLRVVDDQGLNPKTLQREIWLRRRSR